MRILLIHNRYQTRGGEDVVVDAEAELLRGHGHEVEQYLESNDAIPGIHRLTLLARTIWSHPTYKRLRQRIRAFRPQLVHVHNTLPLISPGAYYAAAAEGVPVVQTLHNYRLFCVNAQLTRRARPCEDCVGRAFAWPGIWHACYRDDRAASAAVAGMLAAHHALATWRRKVDAYIALSKFSRDKFVAAGFPAARIFVKPNFAVEPKWEEAPGGPREGALFVGRSAEEKGLLVLLEAWRGLEAPLEIVGTGPLLDRVRREAPPSARVRGRISDDALARAMRRAAFLVMPSTVYEGFPMVVAEAYAAGLPIIASRLGAMEELVEDGRTGLHFEPGDPRDLAAKVRRAVSRPQETRRMGVNARRRYEERYTPEASYGRLLAIYAGAVQARRSARQAVHLERDSGTQDWHVRTPFTDG